MASHSASPPNGRAGDPTAGEDSLPPHHQALLAAAEPLRAELRAKRTGTLARLFELLLARTIEGRPPTELEIANEVFSDGRVIDSTQDSTVRVYVHRLRKLTESVYADREGPALEIRKGEYRIELKEPASAEQSGPSPPQDKGMASNGTRRKPGWLLVALGVALLLMLAFLFFLVQRPDGDRLAATAFWRPLATNVRPTTIVLGDKYLFGQAPPQGANASAPPRLVWDRSIAASEDLYVHLMRRPDEAKSTTVLNQHYVPSSSVTALRDIRAALVGVKGRGRARIRVISASQLTPDILKSSDIVYVGQLGDLGPLLRDPLFLASGLKVGPTENEMIDRVSGRTYRSDGLVLTEERIPRRDYGYIARLPGPSGNNIFVIAGTRDAGLLEMAELARSPEKLNAARLSGTGAPQGMVALYQVRTMGSLNLGSALVLKRKLRSQGIWDKPRSTPARS
ncbi:helix-turn-helix domain-containing protein [Sphingobium cloacae]|uniref:helix-turn-helix domain-containing protein n=1 Tax=Sphingobium cloacae TaxID=120107 RepID=UPI00082D8283|nr:helix-turn-helix domain-containing protein [Sphingobium cloacae]